MEMEEVLILGAKDQAIQASKPAQSHIYLSGCKGLSHINHCPVKSEALALVHGNSPGRFHRVLTEGTAYLLHHRITLLIEHVLLMLPLLPLQNILPSILSFISTVTLSPWIWSLTLARLPLT